MTIPWGLESVQQLADEIARERTGRPAQLLRFGSNGLFRIDNATVLRISPPWRKVERGLKFAYAAAERGLPVLVPMDAAIEERNGLQMTWWPYEAVIDEPVDYKRLGQVVSRLHNRAASLARDCNLNLLTSELRHTQLDKIGDRLVRLRRLEGFEREVTQLSDYYSELRASWSDLAWRDLAVVHGDLYGGNVLTCARGQLLIDFDQIAVGPRSWDYVPIAVQMRRFGLPARCGSAFVDGYGTDLSQQSGFEILLALRELASVTWIAQLALHRPDLRSEVRLRMKTLHGPPDRRVWRAR